MRKWKSSYLIACAMSLLVPMINQGQAVAESIEHSYSLVAYAVGVNPSLDGKRIYVTGAGD